MDMPIRIIITLFVAVVVALGVITFSQKMISNSKTKMYTFDNEEIEEERMIEVNTVSNTQIATLAQSCYLENSNKELEKKICFVILGDVEASESGVLSSIKNVDEDNFEVDLSDAKNAVKIKYNPITDKVLVSG
jgi:hypothetical protein